MRMLNTLHTTLTPEKTPFAATPEVATTVQPKSPWHSPVPYLFGGLAAMLGLIAFALLILACSYWKLSRDDAQQQQNNEARNLDSGEKGDEVSKVNGVPVFEEKIVVIMAGNDKPTFLATPSLMLSSSKNNIGDHDDEGHHQHHDHSPNAQDNGAKEGSSDSNDDDQDDDHHLDHGDHDHVDDDDDDEKAKEDETTHPPHH